MPGGRQHGADFLRRELQHLPALDARRHRDRSIARADEAAHREAERLEQPPHFAIAPFVQHDVIPVVRAPRRRRRSSFSTLAGPSSSVDAGQQRLLLLGVRRPMTRTAYSRSTS